MTDPFSSPLKTVGVYLLLKGIRKEEEEILEERFPILAFIRVKSI